MSELRYVDELRTSYEAELTRLRGELITSGNDKEYQEQHWRAELARLREENKRVGNLYTETSIELARLREIIKQADKDRREIGKRARIAEQEETRLTTELARLREENAVLRRGLHRHAGLDYEDVLADEKDNALKGDQ